jgi:hypothetical protein
MYSLGIFDGIGKTKASITEPPVAIVETKKPKSGDIDIVQFVNTGTISVINTGEPVVIREAT